MLSLQLRTMDCKSCLALAAWCSGRTHCASAVQVPLKRVNQAYVIATSTKVELKGSDVSKLEDSHFKAADKPKEKKGEEGFFKKDTEPEEKVSSCLAALLMSRVRLGWSCCSSFRLDAQVQALGGNWQPRSLINEQLMCATW